MLPGLERDLSLLHQLQFVSPVKKTIPPLTNHAEILAESVLDDPRGLYAASLQEIWSFQQDYGGLSCRI